MKMLGGNKLPDKLLVTTRQKNKINIAFENNMATDIKLPKTLLYKMIQSGDFLGALAALIISNEKINDIMKIVKANYIFAILLKCVTKSIENETK